MLKMAKIKLRLANISLPPLRCSQHNLTPFKSQTLTTKSVHGTGKMYQSLKNFKYNITRLCMQTGTFLLMHL